MIGQVKIVHRLNQSTLNTLLVKNQMKERERVVKVQNISANQPSTWNINLGKIFHHDHGDNICRAKNSYLNATKKLQKLLKHSKNLQNQLNF